ncbi:MAG: AraC family transcriptional regulator [Verrucomicrobiota bacterium]
MSTTLEQRKRRYTKTIQPFFEKLLSGDYVFHLPNLEGLRTQHPDMHFHPIPEVFVQESGANEFTCPGDRFDLNEGEGCLIHQGLPHGEIGRSHIKRPFRNVVLGFAQGALSFLASNCDEGMHPYVEYGDHFITPKSAEALSYLNEISAQKKSGIATEYQRVRVDGLIRAYFSIVLETLERAQGPTDSPDIKLIRAEDLISKHISNPLLSVSYLAKRLNCSPDHFSRIFREYGGVSPNQYIRKKRIQFAVTLLQDPKLNLSEIAWSAGFNSLNYFSRSFSQEMGLSPSLYRKSNRSVPVLAE